MYLNSHLTLTLSLTILSGTLSGTAKTTICTSVASYLGWNFLTIDTASFLANGLQVGTAPVKYDRAQSNTQSNLPHH